MYAQLQYIRLKGQDNYTLMFEEESDLLQYMQSTFIGPPVINITFLLEDNETEGLTTPVDTFFNFNHW